MLQAQIEINDSDIEFSEKHLLPLGSHFDDERKTFIKNLETIDLQAVPGSGKTTALLAKLLILEQQLPFDDGSGILVISHTNSAVDEIKNKIGYLCPKLFNYPNFVGTIQSFVDKFLAIPWYQIEFDKKLNYIDNEFYENHFTHLFPHRLMYSLTQRFGKGVNKFVKSYHVNDDDKIVYNFSDNKFPYKENPPSDTYEALKLTKILLLGEGIIHFDEAYVLALKYLLKCNRIKKIIQKRFRIVFVDEMQDMDKHQHDLLEKIFFDNSESSTIFQRIGDRNQAIYGDDIKMEEIWVHRENELKFNGSLRLSSKNAEVVKYFGLDFIEIDGRNKNLDLSAIDIKPHIIVFNDATINIVVEKYAELIKKLQDENKIPQNPQYPFKAICWRKEVDGDGKIALTNYFDFKLEKHKPKIDYICLSDYIKNCKTSLKEFREIRRNIINALLKILRLEEVQSADGRNFTESKLILFIKEKDKLTDLYELFMKKIFLWSKGIIQGKQEDVIVQIKTYLQEFLLLFGKTIDKSRYFINSISANTQQPPISLVLPNENLFIKDDVEIEISTIHTSKGQTHTATLYLESYYQKGYESDRLKDCFKGRVNSFSRDIRVDVYKKESIRMAYVGISRPTYLLCFAIHKNHFDSCLNDIDRNKWEVIELL